MSFYPRVRKHHATTVFADIPFVFDRSNYQGQHVTVVKVQIRVAYFPAASGDFTSGCCARRPMIVWSPSFPLLGKITPKSE